MINCLYDVFKHWSAKGSIYIMSDTHFDDEDCQLMDPDWVSPEEQVSIINRMVTKNDTLILLGDVGDKEYASKLKGYKVLITGNHDAPSIYTDIFNEIYTGPLMIAPKILLSHEPINGLLWCVNIHGHDHGGIKYSVNENGAKQINLAANVCGYTPINLKKEIEKGLLSDIKDIHRITVDKANENPLHKKEG